MPFLETYYLSKPPPHSNAQPVSPFLSVTIIDVALAFDDLLFLLLFYSHTLMTILDLFPSFVLFFFFSSFLSGSLYSFPLGLFPIFLYDDIPSVL